MSQGAIEHDVAKRQRADARHDPDVPPAHHRPAPQAGLTQEQPQEHLDEHKEERTRC